MTLDVEEEIARIARDLSQHLGYVNLQPQTASWEEKSMSSDHCVVLPNRVVLPLPMKGKLASSEWRPLIAPSLIYYHSNETRRRQRIGLIIALGLVGLLVFPFVPLSLTYGSKSPLPISVVLAYLSYTWATILTVLYYFQRYQARTWLLADRLASERAVESQALVDVLSRIDRMNLLDIEKRKKAKIPWLWLSWRPSITERIQDLQQ
jgi:hypothetical protein